MGLALIAPALGRMIDRYGPRRILLASGILFPASLTALVLAVQWHAATPALIFAAAAGATFPPITVCVRTYFRRRLGDDPLLAAAYSMESVLIEVIFIAGPMVVAFFVAYASTAAAVLFAAACGFLGSLLGPLSEARFPTLVAAVLCFSSAFGFLEIAVTAYATERNDAALAGVLLGIISAGSAVGGLAYGSRSWHLPLARQFAAALALMALGLGVLALRWEPVPFALWGALAGIAMAPALIVQSMLAAQIARPEHATEAFTWVTSALLSGVGIGLAVGGALLEWWPSWAALATGAAAALIAAAIARLAL